MLTGPKYIQPFVPTSSPPVPMRSTKMSTPIPRPPIMPASASNTSQSIRHITIIMIRPPMSATDCTKTSRALVPPERDALYISTMPIAVASIAAMNKSQSKLFRKCPIPFLFIQITNYKYSINEKK